MATLLPPGWIEAQADTAVDTVYDLLEGGDLENAELTIDTTPCWIAFAASRAWKW
jgi:hypothetical protein